jgi:hypothetical protein
MVAALPENTIQSCCNWGVVTRLIGNLSLGMGAAGLITRRDHTLSAGAQLMLKTLRELAGNPRLVENSNATKPPSTVGKDA